jgi:hypothetical protein
VSVDTNTKHKNLQPYEVNLINGIRVLVAPRFGQYCTAVHLYARRGILGPKLGMDTVHAHGPACRH